MGRLSWGIPLEEVMNMKTESEAEALEGACPKSVALICQGVLGVPIEPGNSVGVCLTVR